MPEEHLEKVRSKSDTWGHLSDFGLVLKKGSFCMGGPRNLSQELCSKNNGEKIGSRSKTWGDLSDFCRILKGKSFCKAGPGTCHKKCAQGTFWKKLGAGPTPGDTYLIFVWFCEGGHFARQAPTPVTRNVPKEHFRKMGSR